MRSSYDNSVVASTSASLQETLGASPHGLVARSTSHRLWLVRRGLLIADLVAFAIALAFLVVWLANKDGLQLALTAVVIVPLWLIFFHVYGLYDRKTRSIGHDRVDDLPGLWHALLTGCVLLWGWIAIAGPEKLMFVDVLAFGLVLVIAMAVLRSGAHAVLTAALGKERVLLIGDDNLVRVLAKKLSLHDSCHREVVGLVPIDERPKPNELPVPVFDSLAQADLSALLADFDVERVIVSPGRMDEQRFENLLHSCKRCSVRVAIVPKAAAALGPATETDHIEGITVLGVHPSVLSRSSRILKRAMDITGACVAIVISAPVILVACAAIRIDTPGPVLFRQTRIGRHGRPFLLFKLRTMTNHAEAQTEALRRKSSDPGWLKLESDPRVTPVGRVLRRMSIDELPQLWNVLKGEMSLVGPRPLIESECRQIDARRRSRLELTPGLTGWWQVLGRTNLTFDEMIALDYLYVTNWSLWSDTQLLLRTVPVVLGGSGAN